MNEILINVQGIGKKFCRNLKKSLWYGLCDATNSLAGKAADSRSDILRKDEFWAIEDVSFKVRRGECLGLVGKNGAGKTTILKMLSGLILPDHGSIEMFGRVGGLIALGAGFNPLLTGRENVYVNGAILGLPRREIDKRMDEIVAFADIGSFMDAPVQNYSSGMSVRLGFAIAVVLVKPDILLLDEVLAVGDMGFMIKCLNAVRELANKCAVVFVSHNMQFVSSFCSEVLVLTQGKVHLHSLSVAEGVDAYLRLFPIPADASGSGGAEITKAKIHHDGESDTTDIAQGINAALDFHLLISEGTMDTILNVYIMDQAQTPIICYPDVPHPLRRNANGSCAAMLRLPLGSLDLNAGRYSFVIGVAERISNRCLRREQGLAPFQILADVMQWGSIVRESSAEILAN